MAVAAFPLVAAVAVLAAADAPTVVMTKTVGADRVTPFRRLQAPPPDPTTVNGTVEHVVHVSVDGVNAAMLAALVRDDPAGSGGWHRLVTEGTATFNARTDFTRTDTLPNHTSMLTARPVDRPDGMPEDTHHGRTTNTDSGPGETVHGANPRLGYLPSVFDVVHDNGGTTALYATKSKFSVFDVSYDADHGARDVTGPDDGTDKIDHFVVDDHSDVMQGRLLEELAARDFAYTFVHYLDPDAAGHGSDWGSAVYVESLRRVGGYLTQLMTTIETDPQLAGRTVLIVTSDHGGGAPPNSHRYAQASENHTIPVIVWGVGVPAGADLYVDNPHRVDPGETHPSYTDPEQPIRNGDTGTLALDLLGLPPIAGSLMDDPLRVAPSDGPPVARPPAATSVDGPPPPQGTVAVRVASWTDDVEEVDGRMYLDSSDLELVDDASYAGRQTVGLRFRGVAVPQGARIVAAHLELVVDEATAGPTSLQVRAQAADHAPPFTTATADLTTRTLARAVVRWPDVPAWSTVGALQRTPDLATVVQEVVDRRGWTAGNSLVLVVSGTGSRVARSADSHPDDAPRLVIDYATR